MPDFSNYNLGLVHTAERPGAIRFRDLAAKLAVASDGAAPVNYHTGLTLGSELGNGKCGCCVEAGMYRLAQMRTHAAQGSSWTPVTRQAVGLYTQLTGYNPANPATDNGTDVPTAMQFWVQKGLDLGLQTPDVSWPHVTVDPKDFQELQDAIAWFCGVGISLALPNAMKTADVWDVPASGSLTGDWAPGSWGGHFVPSGRFDGKNFWAITWGVEMLMTPAFLQAYALAGDTGVSQLWFSTTGKTPSGFDLAALRAAAAKV